MVRFLSKIDPRVKIAFKVIFVIHLTLKIHIHYTCSYKYFRKQKHTNLGFFFFYKTIILYLNVLLDLQAVHRDAFLPHVKDFEVVVDTRVLYVIPLAFGLGIPSHLDAEVVTTFLPDHFTVCHVE